MLRGAKGMMAGAALASCAFNSGGAGGGGDEAPFATGGSTSMSESGGGPGDSSTGEPCVRGELDCDCRDSETCDEGLECLAGQCVPLGCGNGELDAGEVCDDGNTANDDGCDLNCRLSEGAARVVAGTQHTCARLHDARVRCWGEGGEGRLGLANAELDIGDDEPASAPPSVGLGEPAFDLSAGHGVTCALLDGGRVRCWGWGNRGRLGRGDVVDVGDDEAPSMGLDVELSGPAVAIATGWDHSCALLQGGHVQCWGSSDFGKLGYGNLLLGDVGDNEQVSLAGVVDLGGEATQVVAGLNHTCALLENGSVRCWGDSSVGQLGIAMIETIGDDEAPSSRPPVVIGIPIERLVAGRAHTCAVTTEGSLTCWGAGGEGRLGTGSIENVGDNEHPMGVGNVELGGRVADIAAGDSHTCALLEIGSVLCWGLGSSGQLGYGNTSHVGDDEVPAGVGPVDIGTGVLQLAAGDSHTCARMTGGVLRCWGAGPVGQLGYGNTIVIGDDEPPSTAGNVPFL